MYTLGINAAFHDSSACIVKDGQLLAAAEEERFTHIKHGKRPVPFSVYELPYHAIDYCLQVAGIRLSDVDHIAYAFDPSKIETTQSNEADLGMPIKELFLRYVKEAPAQLVDGYPHHLQQRFYGARISDFEWHYVEHHIAHAASAFLPSPYDSAAVLTIDGRGEWTTTSYYTGKGNTLTQIGEVQMPHSLGLLYESVTTHLGFLHSSDEYKVMALASYGQPAYLDVLRKAIQVQPNGTYTIAPLQLEKWFGPARKRHEPFTEKHFNIAHSLQKVLEETVLQLVNWLHTTTGEDNLCMAGGVALNCVLNAVIRDNSAFKNIWVQPAAGDAGTALGAALWIDAQVRNTTERSFIMQHAYWGPEYSDEEIERFLQWTKVPYRKMDNVAAETAAILAQDKVIGWYQGRMEFGPRALGSRSILASPISADMQAKLNEIKDREDFRPVAPVVMEEYAGEWFENAVYSPFMLFVYKVFEEKAKEIPAVTHVDRTARIQTINRHQHPAYYDLLDEFRKLTGVPVLVNTSFNTRGEPVVCSPRDAIECFWTSPFDALVIQSFLLEKQPSVQPAAIASREREALELDITV
ncbi:carbamoyltransferase [Filimonas zeae]|uniref:Carbamoyltransferase n=1 Tax=Filimonas zeae TaxID=1737353 RepID=A0A917INQ7_9BACT|nr:carbamoyltransferase C-terminal domain-containing protein [Filimonas zeae]MDR6337160.1 carbamoyltransferase [Filimonas zeae]GGH57277.1 carbamoyltransferase [Filimonas zeae]